MTRRGSVTISLAVGLACACGGATPPARTTASVQPAAVAASDGRVSYLVGGDSRGDKSGVVRWAFQQAQAIHARAFLFLGDMEWSYGCDVHFRQELLDGLAPIPFYPVLGNHEVDWFGFLKGKVSGVDHTTDAERIFQKGFLGTPETPVRSTFGDKVVYSADMDKGMHFVALDNVSDPRFGEAQLQWLERDLAAARSNPGTKHIVVGMHRPLANNCTGGHSMQEGGDAGRSDSDRALALFQRYGVSMILSSHVHNFAQFEQGGIPTYVSGGLGAHLVACTCDDCASFHHLLQLDVSEDDIRVTVVRFPGPQVRSRKENDDDEDNSFPDLRCAARGSVVDTAAQL